MTAVYVSILILVLNVLLWLFFFTRFKSSYSPEKVLLNIREEINQLFKEIIIETDREVSLVEAKIASLKKLIKDAEKMLMLLEKTVTNREKEALFFDNDESAENSFDARTVAHADNFVQENVARADNFVQENVTRADNFSKNKPLQNDNFEQMPLEEEYEEKMPSMRNAPAHIVDPLFYGYQAENNAPFKQVIKDETNDYDVNISHATNSVANSIENELNGENEKLTSIEEEDEVTVEIDPALFKKIKPQIVKSKNEIRAKKTVREQIIELHQQNWDITTIAKQLKLPENEVQVAVNYYLMSIR